MYLDFDDHRPEIPRVPPAISAREGVILSIFFHFLLALSIPLLSYLPRAAPVAAPLIPDREPMRYVHMAPLVDRQAPPRLTAELSDVDRRSSTRERAPEPANALPFSRGNSPERVEGAREERAAGAEAPVPAPAAAPPAPVVETATRTAAEAPVILPPAAAAGNLGASLRNLHRYLETQNFDNQRGGQTDQSADIQFDAKGADFGPWLRRFRNQVMRNWLIPEAAMWQRGRVVLQFNVLRNGTIIDLRIVDPSPIEAFNLAAFNALKMSNPTTMLPADYPSDRAFFTVTFHYNDGQDRR